LREHNDEIAAAGAQIVAIGTGDQRYAAAFVRDEHIPYLVLVDDDAQAAHAASVKKSSFVGMFHPRTWKATRETRKRGFRIHKAGKRVTQMGATFVIGPGDKVVYEHIDDDSTDHASVDSVLGVLCARR
jgi:peroxiredoxin